jgi:hypothetical protein
LSAGVPFENVQSHFYWSSTTYASNTDIAWDVNLGAGFMSNYHGKNCLSYV